MAGKELSIRDFQKYIAERYAKYDRARGTPDTFLWFMEEIGELATAFAEGGDRENLVEEFADVFAWLCTLANINDVDLAEAVKIKYLTPKKRPKGHK
jgi:NTP pyrophosphatase (non-canonical NTP hydrolase)